MYGVAIVIFTKHLSDFRNMVQRHQEKRQHLSPDIVFYIIVQQHPLLIFYY